jgi:hypothetical protein
LIWWWCLFRLNSQIVESEMDVGFPACGSNTWNRELPMKLQDFLFWANFVEDMDQIRKTMMQHEALFKEQVWRFCLIYLFLLPHLFDREFNFFQQHTDESVCCSRKIFSFFFFSFMILFLTLWLRLLCMSELLKYNFDFIITNKIIL